MHAYVLNAVKQAELSPAEMTAAVPAFLAKVARFRPRIVCFVGLGIWRIVHQALLKLAVVVSSSEVSALNPPQMRKVGLQSIKLVYPPPNDSGMVYVITCLLLLSDDILLEMSKLSVVETLLFAMPSTSGRVVSHQVWWYT